MRAKEPYLGLFKSRGWHPALDSGQAAGEFSGVQGAAQAPASQEVVASGASWKPSARRRYGTSTATGSGSPGVAARAWVRS